ARAAESERGAQRTRVRPPQPPQARPQRAGRTRPALDRSVVRRMEGRRAASWTRSSPGAGGTHLAEDPGLAATRVGEGRRTAAAAAVSGALPRPSPSVGVTTTRLPHLLSERIEARPPPCPSPPAGRDAVRTSGGARRGRPSTSGRPRPGSG